MAWMLLAFVMALTRITIAHFDAFRSRAIAFGFMLLPGH